MARLGIVLYHGIASGPELSEYGRLAEQSGFESIWVTERYFHEETFSLLGFLAAATQSIRIGVGVVNPYTRHAGLLAMAAATVDRISGGRLMLGLGRSDRSVIEGKLGIPYGEPRARLEAAVTTIRGLLAGEAGRGKGEHTRTDTIQLAVKPLQSRIPIYLGAIGPRALRLAGAIADGVLLNAYTPVGYVRYAVEEVRAAARDAGRDPDSIDIACMLVVRPTEAPEAIWPDLKRRIVRLLAEPHVGEVLLEKGGFHASILDPLRNPLTTGEDASILVTDEMVEAFYLVGPESRLRERIEEYREAGVDLPLLLPRLEDFRQIAQMFRL